MKILRDKSTFNSETLQQSDISYEGITIAKHKNP